jgi:hypothetical protein
MMEYTSVIPVLYPLVLAILDLPSHAGAARSAIETVLAVILRRAIR